MKIKIAILLLCSLSTKAWCDSAIVTVLIFPVDTGSYVFADKQTRDESILRMNGRFDRPYFTIVVPWPEGNDSMIVCALSCPINLEGKGEFTTNIPVILERNKNVKVLVNCSAFFDDVPINRKVDYAYSGTEQAADFNRLWNLNIDQMAIGQMSNPDTVKLNDLVSEKIKFLEMYMKKYPACGFWKQALFSELTSQRDSATRIRLLSMIPPGTCDGNHKNDFAGEMLCKEIHKDMHALRKVEFKLPDIRDKKYSLKECGGEIILLDFWATWCNPCLKERPELKKLYAEFKNYKQFKMVSISLDKKSERWKNYLNANPMEWLQLLDEMGDVATGLDLLTIPQVIIADKKGNILLANKNLEDVIAFLKDNLK